MFTPGAKIRTNVPQFEKSALVSVLSIAPTAIAEAADAGEIVEASILLLPAATTKTTPAATAILTPSFNA